MRKSNKRWLLSMFKSSGSRRRFSNENYSVERCAKKFKGIDNLPMRESFKRTPRFIQGKLNLSLLVRFLQSNVGRNWDEVYSEYSQRVPSKLKAFDNSILRFVATNIEIVDGKPFNVETGQYIRTTTEDATMIYDTYKFYVEPIGKILCRAADRPKGCL